MSNDTFVPPVESVHTHSSIATPMNSFASEAIPSGIEADVLPGVKLHVNRSETTGDAVSAIQLLHDAGIPACFVGIRALRYYGAGRVTNEWDICVPTDQLKKAEQLFTEADNYEPASPPPSVPKSLRHVSPTFKLKDAEFCILLTTSARQFVNPAPENCERSQNGIPYPKMPHLARSLLVLQHRNDTADFIDGMDLNEQWGEDNIDFEDLQATGTRFIHALNEDMDAEGQFGLETNVDFREMWNEIVENKPKRIDLIKKGRYKTRWRSIANDSDPRTRDRPV